MRSRIYYKIFQVFSDDDEKPNRRTVLYYQDTNTIYYFLRRYVIHFRKRDYQLNNQLYRHPRSGLLLSLNNHLSFERRMIRFWALRQNSRKVSCVGFNSNKFQCLKRLNREPNPLHEHQVEYLCWI